MMKILDENQLSQLDAYTIEKQNLTSLSLMKRAASFCFDWIFKKYNRTSKFVVVCGPGNNGGDGLVLARLLFQSNYDVICVIVNPNNKLSPDNQTNYEVLSNTKCTIHSVKDEKDLDEIQLQNKIIIDSLFGYGLNRSIAGIYKEIIQRINQSEAEEVVSIDIPSGMFCSQLNDATDTIVKANYTLTFHAPKASFFFPEVGNYTGKIKTIDIGLDSEFAENFEGNSYFINQSSIAAYISKREVYSHKGTYGHAHIIAGSKGKMGAAVLAAKAASRSGAGLVTTTIPSIGLSVMQQTVPVAMCKTEQGENQLSGKFTLQENMTYGIGPGIGQAEETVSFFKSFLEQVKNPIVIDADALNILAKNSSFLKLIPKNSILTPHVKEFERLSGKVTNSIERKEELIQFCKENKVFVILKDARTVICTPSGICFYSLNGTPGMATGGSGDCLTGLLTGLLAQNYSPETTCKIGVLLHGIAGELAAEEHTEYVMNAEDIIDKLGDAFRSILK